MLKCYINTVNKIYNGNKVINEDITVTVHYDTLKEISKFHYNINM